MTVVDEVVRYHVPSEDAITAITSIRYGASGMMNAIIANCPPSADRTAALRKVREAMMTANAAIVVPQEAVRQLSQEVAG